MCHNHRELVSSHLMGAALFDYCRNPGLSPIRIANRKVYPTDRQTQDYLLCEGCETVLNRGGEAWVSPKLATIERTFPLYELLIKKQPAYKVDNAYLYLAHENPEIDADRLAHFAMGIFWKASVHTWRSGDAITNIELGPYAEPIRKWLLGVSSFPDLMYLQVAVSTPAKAQIVFNNPYEGRRSECHSYFINVPGVLFVLHVGKALLDAAQMCFYQNPGHPIFVSDEIHRDVGRLFAGQFREAHKTQAFWKAKAKRDAVLAKAQGRS